jgi:hypothetical protein
MNGTILKIVAASVLFLAAFFSFAPENRVFSVKSAVLSFFGNPVYACLEHHKNDFLAPESVRIASHPDKVDSSFGLDLSAITRGGGRSVERVACLKNSKLYGTQEGDKSMEFQRVINSLRKENNRMRQELNEKQLRN